VSIDLANLTIKKARAHLQAGDFTAVELAQSYLDQITQRNKELNAYVEVYDDVIAQAAAADKRIQAGEDAPLLGIPIALKDNMLVAGKRVSAGSKMLENYTATYDATAVAKLRAAGAVFLGRTNMDEFAMGSSTESSFWGPTKNPHDSTRVPGGSSGGAAAVVAANLALASLGSDTGGSIRQPAAFCGVVGMKPTYGAVSRSGLIAMASSLDQIGPITKTVEDTQIIFDVLKGNDLLDSTTLPDSAWEYSLGNPVSKLTIGVPWHLVAGEGIDADVLVNFNTTLDRLQEQGHIIKEIELPTLEYSLAVYYIIMPAEASSNLARFDGVKYGLHIAGEDLLADYVHTRGVGFGKEVRRRIILGTYVLSAGYYDAYYRRAATVRQEIRRELLGALTSVDCILTPTTPTPAFKIGEKTNDPLAMYLADVFTVPANIAGLPSISVPTGFVSRDGKNLPLGCQLMTAPQQEGILFAIAEKLA
jgi:aspartyl-tRNA(Asn)/glutamyl-tRNA(Gln) amidotransferase subunit A